MNKKESSISKLPDTSKLLPLKVDRNTILFFSSKEKLEAAKKRYACGPTSKTRELRWNVNNKPITRGERRAKRKSLSQKEDKTKFSFKKRKLVATQDESNLEAIHRNLLANTTKYEKYVSFILSKHGIAHVIQKEIHVKGSVFFVDIYIPEAKVAIEVDGGYHETKEARNKDRIRDSKLSSIGIQTFRILNKDTGNPRKQDAMIKFIQSNVI